jgi:diphosphomevalonate decarboxylase
MVFENHYRYAANALHETLSPVHGKIAWKCPSNIAIVKYWGKHGKQLPGNPSLSLTLSESVTRMEVEYKTGPGAPGSLEYFWDHSRKPEFEARIKSYLDLIAAYMPFVNQLQWTIRSTNTFPHSAGIASSASAFGALALCLSSVEKQLFGNPASTGDFFRKASFLARLGSGSACRSVFPGFSVWGETVVFPGSSDELAVPVNQYVHDTFQHYHDTILIVSSAPKAVSSSAGHHLMRRHPYAEARYAQARNHIALLHDVLAEGNEPSFIEIMENEALSLHALMMASSPGYFLMLPATLEIISRIRQFRRDSGLMLGFTLDAGPNIHLLYPGSIRATIMDFINNHLQPYFEYLIDDLAGKGPEAIIE